MVMALLRKIAFPCVMIMDRKMRETSDTTTLPTIRPKTNSLSVGQTPDHLLLMLEWQEDLLRRMGPCREPDFAVVDGPGSQIFPHAVYVEKRQQYFIIWDDSRAEPDTNWREVKERDVYARWLTSAGTPNGSDIPICTKAGSQRYSDVAYNPLMERFLITWRDQVNEEVPVPGDSGTSLNPAAMLWERCMGCHLLFQRRVVDKHTRNPVSGAAVSILGIGLKTSLETNPGGWFNIAADGQRKGWYIAVARKSEFRMAVKIIRYTGKPVDMTIELSSRN